MLCNERYIEMYRLRPDHARIGTPLRDLLEQRAAAGTFSGDPDRYVAECLRQGAEGRTETKTVALKDGRIIAVVSRPMRGGGWVATHSDVTERLSAETERDSLRQRDERRRNVDTRDLLVSRAGRERAQDRRPERDRDEGCGEDAADDLGSHAATRRRRGARLQ